MTLDELFNNKEIEFNNRYEQQLEYEYYVRKNLILIDNIQVLSAHVNRAFKVWVLRELPRMSTDDINKLYKINVQEQGVWIRLAECNKNDYYAFVTEDGVYKRARYNYRNSTLTMNVAKNYGTTNQDYSTKRLHYGRYVFDREKDYVGISLHSLVCVAYGLYDGLSVDKIAISHINHKNRNHYDNRPCNLEVSSVLENNTHKIMSQYLIDNNVFRSLDAKHSLIMRSWTDEQREDYIKTLKEIMDSNCSEWINNDVIDCLQEDRYV